MNSSSNIEPFILKSIDELEEEELSRENAFISFFEASQDQNETTLEKDKDSQDDIKDGGEKIDIEVQARKIFEDAYREGEKAGFEMGMKKVDPIIKRLNNDLAAIMSFKEEMLKKVEETSIELALIFTEALVLKECTEHKETLIKMAKKAIDICDERYDIKIRMRRDDIKYISEELINTLNIVPDETIGEPGFIIETNFGEIDGRISTQIEELKRNFIKKEKDG